jgi:hypothetical protein
MEGKVKGVRGQSEARTQRQGCARGGRDSWLRMKTAQKRIRQALQ